MDFTPPPLGENDTPAQGLLDLMQHVGVLPEGQLREGHHEFLEGRRLLGQGLSKKELKSLSFYSFLTMQGYGTME